MNSDTLKAIVLKKVHIFKYFDYKQNAKINNSIVLI